MGWRALLVSALLATACGGDVSSGNATGDAAAGGPATPPDSAPRGAASDRDASGRADADAALRRGSATWGHGSRERSARAAASTTPALVRRRPRWIPTADASRAVHLLRMGAVRRSAAAVDVYAAASRLSHARAERRHTVRRAGRRVHVRRMPRHGRHRQVRRMQLDMAIRRMHALSPVPGCADCRALLAVPRRTGTSPPRSATVTHRRRRLRPGRALPRARRRRTACAKAWSGLRRVARRPRIRAIRRTR